MGAGGPSADVDAWHRRDRGHGPIRHRPEQTEQDRMGTEPGRRPQHTLRAAQQHRDAHRRQTVREHHPRLDRAAARPMRVRVRESKGDVEQNLGPRDACHEHRKAPLPATEAIGDPGEQEKGNDHRCGRRPLGTTDHVRRPRQAHGGRREGGSSSKASRPSTRRPTCAHRDQDCHVRPAHRHTPSRNVVKPSVVLLAAPPEIRQPRTVNTHPRVASAFSDAGAQDPEEGLMHRAGGHRRGFGTAP